MFEGIIGFFSKIAEWFDSLYLSLASSLLELFEKTLFIIHYGCPNSKKAKKLQLRKNLFRRS